MVGTLITDYFTDVRGISLWVSTIAFTILLGVVFSLWYRREGTLSIHSIVTPTREAWYWLAILCTFALGTAAGDLVAEKVNLGYLTAAVVFGSLIALDAIAWKVFKASPVLTFWIAYVLTRPLGASIGDYLSQPHKHGGLALGTTRTSQGMLLVILGLVIYLSVTKRDQITADEVEEAPEPAPR